MNPKLIKFFHAAVPATDPVADSYVIQKAALMRGYVLNPQVLSEDVKAFLTDETLDPNSTFYKTWKDVTSKDRLELFIDQIRHYASTYGSGRTETPYVPEGVAEVPDYENYTYIDVISPQALFERCRGMLYSGIALKSATVQLLCEAVIDGVNSGVGTVDIDSVRNREALVVLCKALGRRPSDPVGLLRYIVYVATAQTLLICSDTLVGNIKAEAEAFDFSTLSELELQKLASIFYRFKPLLLAFRGLDHSRNRVYINRIRRLAPRFHKPLVKGFWETVLSAKPSVEELEKHLPSASSFKLVTVIQAARERLLSMDERRPKQMYIIRNGTVFTAPFRAAADPSDRPYYETLVAFLESSLAARLSPKACSVRFPEGLELTCPASEKNFIGNLPFGSCYKFKGHNFFGIYWRNVWGTRDFDLSFIDWKGVKVGWNENYNTGTTIYSGDLTDADPEASEVIYCSGVCPDGTIMCNRYDGEPGSRFRFFFGQEEIADLQRNYMVRPDSIVVNEELQSDSAEKMLGIVCGAKVYLMDLGAGNSRVSMGLRPGEKELIMARKALSFISLRQLLLKAGFCESDTPELDLEKLDKDTLITLFS